MTSDTDRMAAPAEGCTVITLPIGLHARPSVKLTKLAKTFDSAIRLRAGGEGANGDWVDAKSIVRVMAMKVRVGQTLTFRAEGMDAERAVNALVDLVERNFDESAPG